MTVAARRAAESSALRYIGPWAAVFFKRLRQPVFHDDDDDVDAGAGTGAALALRVHASRVQDRKRDVALALCDGRWQRRVTDLWTQFDTLWAHTGYVQQWDDAATTLHHYARECLQLLDTDVWFAHAVQLPDALKKALEAPLRGYWLPNHGTSLCKVCKQSQMDIVDNGTCLACPYCHYVVVHPSLTQSTVSFGGTNKDPGGAQPRRGTKSDMLCMHYMVDFYAYMQSLRECSLGKKLSKETIRELARKIVRQTPDGTRHMWDAHPWALVNVSRMRQIYNDLWRTHGIQPKQLNAVIIHLTRSHVPLLPKPCEQTIRACLEGLERKLPTIATRHPSLLQLKKKDLPKAVHLYAGLCATFGWDDLIAFPPTVMFAYSTWLQYERVRAVLWSEMGWAFVPLTRPFPPMQLRGQACNDIVHHRQMYAPDCQLTTSAFQARPLIDMWVYAATERAFVLRDWVLQKRRPIKGVDVWKRPSLAAVLRYVRRAYTDRTVRPDRWTYLKTLLTDPSFANKAAIAAFVRQELECGADAPFQLHDHDHNDPPRAGVVPGFLFASLHDDDDDDVDDVDDAPYEDPPAPVLLDAKTSAVIEQKLRAVDDTTKRRLYDICVHLGIAIAAQRVATQPSTAAATRGRAAKRATPSPSPDENASASASRPTKVKGKVKRARCGWTQKKLSFATQTD